MVTARAGPFGPGHTRHRISFLHQVIAVQRNKHIHRWDKVPAVERRRGGTLKNRKKRERQIESDREGERERERARDGDGGWLCIVC